jgi:hypothetical protein
VASFLCISVFEFREVVLLKFGFCKVVCIFSFGEKEKKHVCSKWICVYFFVI